MVYIMIWNQTVSLYQQIVGRGLRLASGQADCLILDYVRNHHILFTPKVGISKLRSDSEPVQVFSPSFNFITLFWGKCVENSDIIKRYSRPC